MRTLHLAVASLLFVACSAKEVPGTQVVFNLNADLTEMEHFWDQPWPSDLRLKDGGPDFRGFPNLSNNKPVSQLLTIASRRPGYAVNTAAYFQFNAPLSERDPSEMLAADPSSPVLLMDLIDGHLFPVVTSTPEEDDYTAESLLAVGPRPGVVLKPNSQYAYVVLRRLKDAEGALLGVPLAMRQLLEGETPDGRDGAAAAKLFEPVVPALKKAKVDIDDVAAVTVFTTGDVVADLFAITEKVRAAYPDVKITGLAPDDDDFGADHADFCELRGVINLPQFQQGPPPWDKEGTFAFDDAGAPIKQRDENVPLTITLPKGEMPKGGWPLMLYFHGSGGNSRDGVDSGPKENGDESERLPNLGPASVVAPLGLASAMSALPISPERVPGASDFAYLNLGNFAAFPDLFGQGVIEQRLFVDALLRLKIDPATVDACTGMSLPASETAHHFNNDELVALGLSMGGMYTNMVGAVEPRIRAVAPTGAGGYWSYFILKTEMLPGAMLIGSLLGASEQIDFLHPALQLAQTGWEWAEPFVFTPRLARRPLPSHPVRPIYQPVGEKDSYFSEPILDALALAYGNRQGGHEVFWPGLQEALSAEGRDGFIDYPVTDNLKSEDGTPYTGVVVPWKYNGYNGHHVVFQVDEVKHQYGCFFTSFLKTGHATVVAPDGDCP